MALITASRYNTLQSSVEGIMGTGSGDSGYGQTLASSQVAQGTVIEASHMANLYTDMIKARRHQTGTTPNTLSSITVGDLIKENDVAGGKGIVQYEALAVSINTDKLAIYTGDTSQSDQTPLVSSTRTNTWNGTITHEFTATFTSADARRHFFNAGGKLLFTADITNGSGAKYNDWNTLLSAMGTVSFAAHATSSNGGVPGTGSAIGNYELTGTYQKVFQKDGSGVYAENDYNIHVKENNTSAIQVRIQFRDDDAGDDTNNDGAFDPQDEDINGDVSSSVVSLKPNGADVSVAAPIGANVTTLQ
tara:strand:- start:328 stop:1239 length:912 start_codon:yes stop_codon:yes gene_type:complete